MYCLQCFSSKEILSKHKNNCIIINGKQAIKMPNKGETVQFTNFQKQALVPFVIYADFEAIVVKIQGVKQSEKKSYTDAYQKHKDCSYAYKVVCCYDDQFSKPLQMYRGENAVYKFLEKMLEEEKWCKETMKKHFNKQLEITAAEEKDFKKSESCHICGNKYEPCDVKIRDHCHITGKYRGSGHHKCNINYKLTERIPVIFHNLRGYDSHFIMQEIGKFNRKINVIPNNMERYMSFMLGNHLVFLDSFQFTSRNLDYLVSCLPIEAFKYTKEAFPIDEQFNLMKQKGVHPYDYMDSFKRFEESELPSMKKFYGILNDEHISEDDHEHARKVWELFHMKNLGEYHDLYLKTDVLLLTDVFENFRKTCMQYYKLDSCHYFTSPGLAWGAMLKMTGVRLELMSDIVPIY